MECFINYNLGGEVYLCNIEILRMESNNYINYSYIVYNKYNVGLIIDPSWDYEKVDLILTEKKIQLQAILITHEHFDHINLAEKLSHEYKIPIYISWESIQNCDINRKNAKIISNESIILVDDIPIHPIFTPGHTKGSISYLISTNLFTGDTLFIEGCGMCTDATSSPQALFYSLKHLLDIIPKSTKIYPGHRYHAKLGKSFSYTISNNIHLNIDTVEDFITFRMRPNQKGLMNFI